MCVYIYIYMYIHIRAASYSSTAPVRRPSFFCLGGGFPMFSAIYHNFSGISPEFHHNLPNILPAYRIGAP